MISRFNVTIYFLTFFKPFASLERFNITTLDDSNAKNLNQYQTQAMLNKFADMQNKIGEFSNEQIISPAEIISILDVVKDTSIATNKPSMLEAA